MVKEEQHVRHIEVGADINEPWFVFLLLTAALVLGPRVPTATLLTLCALEPHLHWRHGARVYGPNMYLLRRCAAPKHLVAGALAASALPWAFGAPAWAELMYGVLAWAVLRLGCDGGERLLHTYSGSEPVSPSRAPVAMLDDIAVTSSTHDPEVMAGALAHWKPFQNLRASFEAAGSPITELAATSAGAPPFRFVFLTRLRSDALPYEPCYLLREPTAAVAVWVDVAGVGPALVLKSEMRPCGTRVLELPAGIVEEGEMPYVAAAREMREELGIYFGTPLHRAAALPLLPSVGGCSEQLSLFFTPCVAVTPSWVCAVQALENQLAAEGEVGVRLTVVYADRFENVQDLKAHAALATLKRARAAIHGEAKPLTDVDLVRARARRIRELDGEDRTEAEHNLQAMLARLEADALLQSRGLDAITALQQAAVLTDSDADTDTERSDEESDADTEQSEDESEQAEFDSEDEY